MPGAEFREPRRGTRLIISFVVISIAAKRARHVPRDHSKQIRLYLVSLTVCARVNFDEE
jgi:hypothetical protein